MAFSSATAAAWLALSTEPGRVGSGSANDGTATRSSISSAPSRVRALITPEETPAAAARAAGGRGPASAAASTFSRAGVIRAGLNPVAFSTFSGRGLGALAPLRAMARGWPGLSTA